MNCLSCINKEYFYKNDTKDCILPKDFQNENNFELTKTNNVYFYIFIVIFVIALIIFIFNCKCYKVNNKTNQQANQKQNEKEKGLINKKIEVKIEMDEYKPELNNPINDED